MSLHVLWLIYTILHHIWNPIHDSRMTMLHSSYVNHVTSLRQQAPGARQSTGMFGTLGTWRLKNRQSVNHVNQSREFGQVQEKTNTFLSQTLHLQNDSNTIRQMNPIRVNLNSRLNPWKVLLLMCLKVKVCWKHYAYRP